MSVCSESVSRTVINFCNLVCCVNNLIYWRSIIFCHVCMSVYVCLSLLISLCVCVCVYCWQPALIGFSLYWQPAIVTFFLHWQINFFFFFYCKSSQVISVKLTVMTNGTNRLSFGSDPVLGTDFGSLFHFPQHCRIAHFMRFNSICHTVTPAAFDDTRRND